MNRSQAGGLLAGLVAVAAFAMLGPAVAVLAAAMVVLLAAYRHRGLAAFTLVALTFNILFLSVLRSGGEPLAAVGDWDLTREEFQDGMAATARLTILVGFPLLAFSRVRPAVWLEGLQLPPKATYTLAAIVLASQDLADDWKRMRALQPSRSRIRRAIALIPAMAVQALERGRVRAEALRMAGIHAGPAFAATIGFASLAAVGRLATAAVPNVAPTFLICYLAGWYGGMRMGIAVGALSMAVTDLMLSGFAPTGMVNIPAMAFVGALGAFAPRGRLHMADKLGLAATGILATFAFSMLSDSMEWFMLPELRAVPGAWQLRVLAGLTFNVPSAIINGLLFASVVPAAQKHLGSLRAQAARADALDHQNRAD